MLSAIGLMSGTSCDGIDLSYIRSDGKNKIEYLGNQFIEYSADFKNKLKYILQGKPSLLEIKLIENELTMLHADIVNYFLQKNNIEAKEVDLIGFHGQTILHRPDKKITWQIGNSDLLQNQTKIKVISNFRNPDVAAGGQGAPLVPIYHFYLIKDKTIPTLIVNIGGIANLTYFNNLDQNSLKAFDFCFGNALSDDLVKKNTDLDFDQDGNIAIQGKINFDIANDILQNKIFHLEPPKSFDRHDFDQVTKYVNNLELPDALATLSYIFAKVLQINIKKFLPISPKKIIICGGGRKNKAIISQIKQQVEDINIIIAEDSNLNGDYIESEAFAFLAIRKSLGFTITISQ